MKQFKQYVIIVFLLSIPLWVLGYIFDATNIIPVKLPISALQFLCVPITAIIVTKRSGGSVISLLKRGLDINRIKVRGWQYGIYILMPITVFASYLLMQWGGLEQDNKQTPAWNIPIFLLIYGISGYGEQIGWTAIATDKLLNRFDTIITGLIVGIIWALWHIIPFTQTHNSATWIGWQCIYTIVYRILMTKIYVLTNRSVFATIALHATYNTAFSMMPYFGSSYNPMYMTLATCIAGFMIFFYTYLEATASNKSIKSESYDSKSN